MNKVLKLLFGDPNVKLLKELRTDAEKVSVFEKDMKDLSDDQLRVKTDAFKKRLADGESLEDISYEAFAVVREVGWRTLKQRHYDVQMMGGLALHRGMIAEMRTGEGKTLTSTLPIYLNALEGKGVHVVTVNDYLAKRDAVWMGQIFHFLGLTLGCIQHESGYVYDEGYQVGQVDQENQETDSERDETGSFKVQMDFLRPCSRQDAYAADVTYGTNNEFGFDYLRDNMVTKAEQMVQRELHYAIVDEIDSILIDEARTPLIVSAPAEESADLYVKFAGLVKDLKENVDYNIDEKMRVATFTDDGIQGMEKRLGVDNMYTAGGLELVHHAEQALRAQAMYHKDKEYVVQDDAVKIVDEFTGRIMEGRRYGEGLHQAIEAKEGVTINRESRTLATITFQNYFRMYNKLAGMTGTAFTESEEFMSIYGLEVVDVPTNKPIARADAPDRMYKTLNGKLNAVVQDAKERQKKGQPVLIGTVSIDDNLMVSELLKNAGVEHAVLNAKNHEGEGQIVAQAGRKGGVTVATNMAGRGVDIKLGGSPCTPDEEEEVKRLGGLHVIGTERHEARRIDNQLRGRSGRQGDPGSTQFYVSMDDKLMRVFGTDRAKGVMEKLGIDENTPIESKMLTNSLEKAQERVEGRNFDSRKHVLEYDDVLNKHRNTIYKHRRAILKNEIKPDDEILKLVEEEVERVTLFHTGTQVDLPSAFQSEPKPDRDPKEIVEVLNTIFPASEDLAKKIETEIKELSMDKEELARQRSFVIEGFVAEAKVRMLKAKEAIEKPEQLEQAHRTLMLRASDNMWVRHLDEMRYLRRSIGLRGYGQRDPLLEYKKESFHMFESLQHNISREIVYNVYKMLDQAVAAQAVMQMAPSIIERAKIQFQGAKKTMGDDKKGQTFRRPASGRALAATLAAGVASASANASSDDKVGRNKPCPCGSGKKFKKCHGA